MATIKDPKRSPLLLATDIALLRQKGVSRTTPCQVYPNVVDIIERIPEVYGNESGSFAARTATAGAHQSRVVGMEIKSALRLLVFGIVLGLPAAWVASQWVKSMLFGLTPADPATISGAVISLTAASAAGSVRTRATRIARRSNDRAARRIALTSSSAPPFLPD